MVQVDIGGLVLANSIGEIEPLAEEGALVIVLMLKLMEADEVAEVLGKCLRALEDINLLSIVAVVSKELKQGNNLNKSLKI